MAYCDIETGLARILRRDIFGGAKGIPCRRAMPGPQKFCPKTN